MTAYPSLRAAHPTKWLTVTAMLMALNIALSSFGVPVPGGHLYLNDIVICTAAILLDPLGSRRGSSPLLSIARTGSSGDDPRCWVSHWAPSSWSWGIPWAGLLFTARWNTPF